MNLILAKACRRFHLRQGYGGQESYGKAKPAVARAMARQRRIKMTQRIKLVGPKMPRIDPIKLAKALGADTVISGQKQAKDGRYYIEITSVEKNGHATKRRAYQLDKNSVKKYTLLRTVEGADFYHCLSLLGKYEKKDCHKQICGYCVKTPTSPLYKFAISFYTKK